MLTINVRLWTANDFRFRNVTAETQNIIFSSSPAYNSTHATTNLRTSFSHGGFSLSSRLVPLLQSERRILGYRQPNGLSSTRRSLNSVSFGAEKVESYRVRVSICRVVPPLLFKDLDTDDYRHPLDKHVVQKSPNEQHVVTKAIPGLNEFGKALLGSMTEQIMLLENIGTSVLVSTNQLSDLHGLLVEAAVILNIEAPDLYVRQSPVPNYTLAISGKKPFIVVHTSLIELLTREELQVVSVLMKLAGGCPSMSDQLNVDAFLEQARSYDKASSRPLGWYIRNAQTSQLSHPLPVLRAREIDEWSRSLEYRGFLKQANRMSTV